MEEIVIRSLQGIAGPEEEERIERWRAADPENDRAYREIVRLWEATQRGDRRPPRTAPPSSFEIIRTVRLREEEARRRRLELQRVRASRWSRRIAAGIALLAAGFAGSLIDGPKPLMAGGIVATSASEMATVTLPDGTIVRIGPSSQIRLPAGRKPREVWLEGEAFFSVAAPDDRPFTVRTGSGEARALETRFHIRSEGQVMEVGVLEGTVEVSTLEEEREVSGGEVGEVADGHLTVAAVENPEELRPQLGNFLAFRSTPLTTVVQEISAHYGLPARLADPALGPRTVTASFNDATFVEVMSVVCRITASRCTLNDSIAVVEGSGAH